MLVQARSTFSADSVIGARAASLTGYSQAPGTQLGPLELGFKFEMPKELAALGLV